MIIDLSWQIMQVIRKLNNNFQVTRVKKTYQPGILYPELANKDIRIVIIIVFQMFKKLSKGINI